MIGAWSQRRLVEALLDPGARLLVSDTEKGETPTVRVAHEALISRWARAREFVQSNAEALKIRHRIEERYLLWHGLKAGDLGARPHGTSPPPSFGARLAAWRPRLGREPIFIVRETPHAISIRTLEPVDS